MLEVAAPNKAVFVRAVDNTAAQTATTDEAEIMGRAIAMARERAGLSQEDLAERMAVSRQTISRYESGRAAVLRSDLQRRVADALGISLDDLMAERDNLVFPDFKGRKPNGGGEPPGPAPLRTVVAIHAQPEIRDDGEVHYVEVPPLSSEDLGWLFGPNAGFIRLAEGSLPEGGITARVAGYDKSEWPRAGQGCVIETRDGELLPRLYQRRTEAGLLVTAGEPIGTETVPYKRVRGVYAIRFYGD